MEEQSLKGEPSPNQSREIRINIDGDSDDSPHSPDTSTSDSEKVVKNAQAAKKELDQYYKKQNEILVQFQQDSEQIEAARRAKERRRQLNSTCESEPTNTDEGETLLSKTVSTVSIQSNDTLVNRHENAQKEEKKTEKAADRLAKITLTVNFGLILAKFVASCLSGSMSIISSLVDSIVDLSSGVILTLSSRMVRKRDPYQYPRGRTRVEPLSLILISVIMGMASLQLIIHSWTRLWDAAANGIKDEIDVEWPTIGIMLGTIAIKFTLYIVCQKYKNNSSINVLAQDHRNDCISNSVALACAWIAYYYGAKDGKSDVSLFGLCPENGCDMYYLDPIGAIIVSIYILSTWMRTGYAHFVMLSGKSAKPELINRIIHQSIIHDERITHLDTVYVYHYGTKFLVEVHIVLNGNMSLKDSHDIAESLQTGIESLAEIERAFVHCDYDFNHHPYDEHKNV